MTVLLIACILCPEMADKITCPKCGKPTPDARFCKHCGEPLHSCMACGAKISSDSKFCTECGVELTPEEVSAVSEAVPKAYARYGPSLIPKYMLVEGEVPLYETRPVLWLRLMAPVVFFIVGSGILVAPYFHFHIKEILYGCGGFFLLGALWAVRGWLIWRYTIYAATSRRILKQTGIIAKSYVDCPLPGVQTVHLHISLWGRLNGFGTVHIVGGGADMQWDDVDEPREVHRILNEIVEQYKRESH